MDKNSSKNSAGKESKKSLVPQQSPSTSKSPGKLPSTTSNMDRPETRPRSTSSSKGSKFFLSSQSKPRPDLPESRGCQEKSISNVTKTGGSTDKESYLDIDQIIVLASSGDKDKEDIAIQNIQKLMSSNEYKSKQYYRLEALRTKTKEGIATMEAFLFTNPMMNNPEMSINERRGWMLISHTMIQYAKLRIPKPLPLRNTDFVDYFERRTLTLLLDIDPKVQKIAMEILTFVAKKKGEPYFQMVKTPIVERINGLLCVRSVETTSYFESTENRPHTPKIRIMPSEISALSEFILIQCFKALNTLAKIFKKRFVNEIDEDFLKAIFSSLEHPNASIREAAHAICLQIISTGLLRELAYGLRLTYKIVEGFGDFTSSIRIATARTVKEMIVTIENDERDAFFEAIIPPLCLSRYFTKDPKFMLLCQSIWKEQIKDNGKLYVCRYMEQIVNFYISSLKSKNPGVQVAAAASIAELASKIEKEHVVSYLPQILSALELAVISKNYDLCDATTLTLGSYFVNYPLASLPYANKLLPHFQFLLGSPIIQIRMGASATISKIILTYKNAFLEEVINDIVSSLRDLYTYEPEPETDQNLDDDRTKLLEIQQGAANSTAVVMDDIVWNKADGCLYLMADLCTIECCKASLLEVLPHLFQAMEIKWYPEHVVLTETACKIIPTLLTGLGKSVFKENINEFFNIIFYVLELNDHSSCSARMCLREIAKTLGRNILRGRIEIYNPKFTGYLDANSI